EFNSDLAYQDYLNDFNSEDYTVDIYQTETVYQSNQTTIKSYESTILNNQIFSIIFICAIFIVMGILSFLINQKALNKLFLKGENANNYLIANISFGIVSLIVLLIFNGILTNSAIRSLDVPLFNNLYSGKIFSIYIFGFISILLINIIIFILNRGNQTRLKRK
ncbi:MAG: hypothetical protein M0Q94_15015, partial [Candidatus Cloacimonetes bacterium]|nr:hypothetical protein [Candidatus Cloacimonadota bacterium]